MTRLDRQVAIVTGGGRGIGAAIARRYAAEGARVLIVFRGDAAAADATREAIVSAGGEASVFQGDVSRAADMEAMAARAAELYGRIDVVCCNAGIFPITPLGDMSENDWDAVHAVNLKGAFLTVKACLPYLRRQGAGRIVVVASITGAHTGLSGLTHYAASKAGLLGFVNSACIELAPDNITVNAVLPGMILTDEVRRVLGDEGAAAVAGLIPAGRLGDPDDVAHAALFFSTHESRYVTGQSLVVDGGMIRPELPLPFVQNLLAPGGAPDA